MDLKIKLTAIDTAINSLKNLDAEIAKLEKEREEFKAVVESMWKIFDVCPKCRGEKRYFQRSCAEDEGEVRVCGRCEGSGRFREFPC